MQFVAIIVSVGIALFAIPVALIAQIVKRWMTRDFIVRFEDGKDVILRMSRGASEEEISRKVAGAVRVLTRTQKLAENTWAFRKYSVTHHIHPQRATAGKAAFLKYATTRPHADEPRYYKQLEVVTRRRQTTTGKARGFDWMQKHREEFQDKEEVV